MTTGKLSSLDLTHNQTPSASSNITGQNHY